MSPAASAIHMRGHRKGISRADGVSLFADGVLLEISSAGTLKQPIYQSSSSDFGGVVSMFVRGPNTCVSLTV
jgi:hypothetical protein